MYISTPTLYLLVLLLVTCLGRSHAWSVVYQLFVSFSRWCMIDIRLTIYIYIYIYSDSDYRVACYLKHYHSTSFYRSSHQCNFSGPPSISGVSLKNWMRIYIYLYIYLILSLRTTSRRRSAVVVRLAVCIYIWFINSIIPVHY